MRIASGSGWIYANAFCAIVFARCAIIIVFSAYDSKHGRLLTLNF